VGGNEQKREYVFIGREGGNKKIMIVCGYCNKETAD